MNKQDNDKREYDLRATTALPYTGYANIRKSNRQQQITMKTKKQTQKEKIRKALVTLNKIEYSSDGFVKRYPEQKEYDEAVALLESIVKEEK
ncbi:MAG: hypothetical protein ABWX90_03285 [Candidatus Saccharimonadales bacterium]